MSVDISLNVRLDQLRAELSKIPGLTEREVRQAVRGAELQWKRMPAAAARAARESAARMEQITASIQRISPAAGAATAAVEQLGAVLGPGIAATLGPLGLVAAGVAAIGGASFVAANRMSAMVDEVALLAEGTGLSTRQMIAIRHAVNATGGQIDKTKEALASFTRVMGTELAGKTGPEVDRVLRNTIARIEGIESPADRAAERMRVFGTESARALAGLTSGNLAEAERQTASLADRIDRAAGSSAKMDEANAKLQRSLDELVVVLGDKLAPAVVKTTNALAGMADAATSAVEGADELNTASGGLLGTLASPLGAFTMNMWNYADATREAARANVAAFGDANRRAAEQKRLNDERQRALDIERAFGLDGPVDLGGRVNHAGAKQDAARVAAARNQAAKVAEARRQVEQQFRRDAFAAEVEAGVERAAMMERAQAMERALAAEEAAAHAERMRRAQEEIEAQRQIRLARIASTQAIVSGAADAIAAIDETSRFARAAGLAESLVNFGTAITSAFAQGGPIAGPALAASVIGQLAPVISSMRALVGGGPAAPRTGGGSGGGGGGGRPFGRSEYGFTGTDGRGNTIMVAEYRSEIYDAQSYDAIRRPGSPLRDLSRRQRVSR